MWNQRVGFLNEWYLSWTFVDWRHGIVPGIEDGGNWSLLTDGGEVGGEIRLYYTRPPLRYSRGTPYDIYTAKVIVRRVHEYVCTTYTYREYIDE